MITHPICLDAEGHIKRVQSKQKAKYIPNEYTHILQSKLIDGDGHLNLQLQSSSFSGGFSFSITILLRFRLFEFSSYHNLNLYLVAQSLKNLKIH